MPYGKLLTVCVYVLITGSHVWKELGGGGLGGCGDMMSIYAFQCE